MDKAMIQMIDYLWSQSWQIALLVAAVAVINRAMHRRSAHARYLLWLLVVAKCLIPPMFAVSVPILPQERPSAFSMPAALPDGVSAATAASDTPETVIVQPPPGPPGDMHPSHRLVADISPQQAIVLVWLTGLVAFAVATSIKAGRMALRLTKERTQLSAELRSDIDELFHSLTVRQMPRVWLVESASQPFVWGLWRGGIYLPSSFVTLSIAEHRRDILAHELSHVLRLDAAVNLLQVLAQAVFWFHPLVWWANMKTRQERENCCDEMAIARLGAQPRRYSQAIVEVLLAEHKSNGLMPSLAIAGPAKNIEERIKTMLRPGKRFYRRPSLLAVACALALALLIVPTTLALTSRPADGPNTQAKETKTNTEEEQIQQRVLSADKLKKLGLSLIMYAMDHDGKYADELITLMPYFGQDRADELAAFVSNDAEYLGAGKTPPKNDAQDVALAYDLTLLRGGEGTNVVFADGHVEFVTGGRLDKYGIKLPESRLEIQNVRFEPIHRGKNVVHVTVQNTSDTEQVFATHIYTRSPDYGEGGVGWGTPFYETFAPRETKSARFVFKIQGPVTDRTYVTLHFYNPETQDKYESKRYFEQRRYASADLEKARADQVKRAPASPAEAQAVTQAFNQIQGDIQNRQYEQAWERFSKDFREAEYQARFEWFRRAMEPTHPMHSAFTWERGDFLKLKPGQVLKSDGVLTLAAALDGQTWSLDFVQDAGRWKIDWIAGYVPAILQIRKESPAPAGGGGNVTTSQEKRSTAHFDIYYPKDSTAARDIDRIAKQKDDGFRQICQFLGRDSNVRIRLVLFEDKLTKQRATGHQGAGWAYGNTVVEVYNAEEKLDPYHETTHILMGSLGGPPALFNEGFAVYISEKLGARALEGLGGGQATIYARVKELKTKGDWIELPQLLSFTNIGPAESRPTVSYPEAASFVKFLIDTYGKDKFLQAYQTLRNSGDKATQEENVRHLEQICGKPLQTLQQQWEAAFTGS